jgi:hypothetical protein
MASKYDDKTKEEVVAFIRQYNQENGRGGQSAAVKKWDLNAVTVKSWLEKAGVETPGRGGKKKRGARKARAAKVVEGAEVDEVAAKPGRKRGRKRGRKAGRKPGGKPGRKPGRKAASAAASAGDFDSILARMVAIRKELASLESEYAALKAKL